MPAPKHPSEKLSRQAAYQRRRRSPESHIAGGAPLARVSGRVSDGIDVFHDAEEAVLAAMSASD